MMALSKPQQNRLGTRDANTCCMTTKQSVETMNKALSESGIVCFAAINQPLVDNLCETIGVLYRALQAHGMTEEQIEALFNP